MQSKLSVSIFDLNPVVMSAISLIKSGTIVSGHAIDLRNAKIPRQMSVTKASNCGGGRVAHCQRLQPRTLSLHQQAS